MLKAVSRDQVLEFVKREGPTIPARIVKALGGDTFLIGAHLSDLASNKYIKVTTVKIGGSPFYYAPGQEPKLTPLSSHLNEKDRRTYEQLRQHRILRDEDQDPFTKVSLRSLKDFAKPIEVILNKEKVLFWKFFQVTNKEVEQIIRDKYLPKKAAVAVEQAPAPKQEAPIAAPHKETPAEKKEESRVQPPAVPEPFRPERGTFEETLHKFFAKKDILVLEREKIRKTEYDFILEIPSAIGTVHYYAKAKDKKRSNDGDLASAYIKGKSKNLPVLYITTGQITKKAQEMLPREFKGLKILPL